MEKRGSRHSGKEPLEMIGGGDGVGVLLRDHFALFGHSKVAHQRGWRQSFQEDVRRTGAGANSSSPAMKESDAHSGAAAQR